MRLVCPNCEAKYEVPDDAIPDSGRDVQCANCGHAWFQMRARAGVAPAVADAQAETAAAGPAAAETEVPDKAAPQPTPAAPEPAQTGEVAEAVVADDPAPHDHVPHDDVPHDHVPHDPVADSPIAEELPPEAAAALDVALDAQVSDPAPAELSPAELSPDLAQPDLMQPDESVAAELAMAPGPEPEGAVGPVGAVAAEADGSPDAVADADPASEQPLELGAGSEQLTVDAAGVDAAGVDAAGDDAAAADAAGDDGARPGDEDPAPVAAAPYAVDDSVLAILREEAEREATARRAESLESQTDLGIETVMPPKVAALAAEVEAKPSARRDLLPDVEEINSTLRPSETQGEGGGAADFATLPPTAPRGFRSGFLAVMTIAILAAALYIVAPRLGGMVPALAGPLDSYVSLVDSLRLGLDGMMRSATVAINGS